MKSLTQHIHEALNESWDSLIDKLAKAVLNGDKNVDVLRYKLKRSSWTDADIDKQLVKALDKLKQKNSKRDDIARLNQLQKINSTKLSYAQSIEMKQLLDKYPNELKSINTKFTKTKYQKLVKDAAKMSQGHSFDAMKNMLHEPGLIDYVKRNEIRNNESPEERIQWDIESYI